MNTTGLLTDQYEITMLDALIEEGKQHQPAVFEAFTRKIGDNRSYGIVAGIERIITAVENFTFPEEDIEWLKTSVHISDATAEYLRNYRFTGTLRAYPEGETYYPYSPVLQIEGTLGEGLILETLILSILNYDTAIASAAARIHNAKKPGQSLYEMGTRRSHETAAIAKARAAYIAGFDGTSNLHAAKLYNIPPIGTMAHAFVLAHETEEEAFHQFIKRHGTDTTLLVDTYNIREGIATAIKVAGPQLAAIRLDSGNLAEEIPAARAQLDKLGAPTTRIVVTNDLDAEDVQQLSSLPVNGFGIGTKLATGSGQPTSSFVYKLVATKPTPTEQWKNVEKLSSGKKSMGGKKNPHREYSTDGTLLAETFYPKGDESAPIYTTYIENGDTQTLPTLENVRETFLNAMKALPAEAKTLTRPDYDGNWTNGGQTPYLTLHP